MRVIDSRSVIEVRNLERGFPIYESPSQRFLNALTRGLYQPRREFLALRDVSLTIARGEVVGVIGRNGSGKSTLLQIVSGIMPPSSGNVEVHGKVAALLELGTGFDFEETGRSNIEFNARLLGMRASEISERIDAIIEFADIGDFIDQPMKNYSSGMIVRLGFAINAHIDADVLIVDEALSVGDSAFQFKCLSRLDDLLKKGVTVLLVSHDAQLIKSYCTRAIYLRQGSIVFDGDCETACEMYQKDSLCGKVTSDVSDVKASTFSIEEEGSDVAPGAGRILGTTLGGNHSDGTVFNGGTRIYVGVHAQVGSDISKPCVTVVVRDLRGYNLFAFNNHHHDEELSRDRDGNIHACFSFVADLQAGDYALAVRLDDAFSPNIFRMLDKKVNAAGFSVFRDKKQFDAVVNLHGRIEAVSDHA
ncbi:ABC transporter ATP-binding protein [Pseudomonas sp. GD04087]|uniref:ABC transporter ATP-binding protein n=1 Tax=unclassified Pseudomonas TaxID=196821 RepID=UPI00244D71DD|nr:MULTISPECIES: ABC transporter ATP-binding protein [unclassified Pseudomonas]MDH0287774.1 ABC transporter ATP-binding protein [Pseudomonas sp. GD04087]MDH1050801.1 ABC transporter ATP-binding protein [Pseudomonas sp. GD03903]MDH2002783.1 ABC transporter ATP-binding protein [Pseudomonas sp. GD03691]